MIREVKTEDLPECVNVIRLSFRTVADEFGFTEENAPRFTAFATTEVLYGRWKTRTDRCIFTNMKGRCAVIIHY